jgi:predicted transcriptional regulator
MVTSIQLDNKTKIRLEKMKLFPREPYNDVVNRLINAVEDDEGELNEQTIRDLERALREMKAGKFISHEEIKRKHGL